MKFDFVASTIIGASNAEQLDVIFDGLNYKISDELNKELAAVHQEILYPMG